MIWERVFTKSLHINLLKYIMGVANKKIHQGLYRVTRVSASKLTWTIVVGLTQARLTKVCYLLDC